MDWSEQGEEKEMRSEKEADGKIVKGHGGNFNVS